MGVCVQYMVSKHGQKNHDLFIELSWFYRRRIQILFGSIIPHRLCKYPAYATGCSSIRSEKEWNGRVAPRVRPAPQQSAYTLHEHRRQQKTEASSSSRDQTVTVLMIVSKFWLNVHSATAPRSSARPGQPWPAGAACH